MTTIDTAGDGKNKSRFRIPPIAAAGIAAGLTILSIAVLKTSYGNDPVAALPAGVVYRVEAAPTFQPRGLWSWFAGEQPVDRSYVVTDKERHLVNYVAAFPVGAAVEVRDTVSAGRQLCTVDGAHCRKLWNDETQLVAVDETGEWLSLLLKIAGVGAACMAASFGLLIVLRSAFF
jgi:hypothetical protein